MTPREEAQLWMQSADSDFEVIDGCVRAGVHPWNQLCFHAQQGAEKYLKALLVANGIAPPKTHNLAKLVELLLPFQPSVAALMPECVLLTPYAVAERYVPIHPDEASAGKVIQAGERVRDEMRKLLG
jgi:HEPN domain-containing protein